MSGKLNRLQTENGVLNISLAIGETAVVLLTDENYTSENKSEFKTRFDISDNFIFRKETELVCGENGFENIVHSDESVSVKSGDWSSLIGCAYSGSCAYETTFTLPDEMIGKKAEISLGDVRFAASVYINDRFLGTAFMSPYKLKIPVGVLEKDNKLKIIVTNTSANWYAHTDYFDKWDIKELSPYYEAEFNYSNDFVSGGLYGPVVIYTEKTKTS